MQLQMSGSIAMPVVAKSGMLQRAFLIRWLKKIVICKTFRSDQAPEIRLAPMALLKTSTCLHQQSASLSRTFLSRGTGFMLDQPAFTALFTAFDPDKSGSLCLPEYIGESEQV